MIAFFAAASLALSSPEAWAPPPSEVLTAEEVATDLALMKETLERVHPGYERYASPDEVEAAWDALRAATAKGSDQLSFYLEISEFLTAIRCEHTKGELPNDLKGPEREGRYRFPARFQAFGNRLFIDSAPEGSPFQRGDEILSINGVRTKAIVKTLIRHVSYDGYTDYSRRRSLETDGDLFASGFERFFPLVYGYSERFEVRLRRPGDGRKTVSAGAITQAEWNALPWGRLEKKADFPDSITVAYPAEGVGYLRVASFVNYRRPVSPAAVLDPVFEEFEQKGVETLIIDLRENGGGSEDAERGLFRRLIREPFQPVSRQYRKTLDFEGLREAVGTWDESAINPQPERWTLAGNGFGYERVGDARRPVVEPHPKAFGGDIVVLSSEHNASASTFLLRKLQEQPHVTVLGDRTGGNVGGTTAGVLVFLTLPESGVVVRVPLFRYSAVVEGARDGYGVEPDVFVPETLKAFRAGRDIQLERAVALAAAGR
ncbi:MAG: S41 family peptidase [Pseudomonadota bacterium]